MPDDTTGQISESPGNSLAAGSIRLKCGYAPALAGEWSGRYSIDGGNEGWQRTKLQLVAAGPDTVDGAFTYIIGTRRWQERHPDSGYIQGRILPDGKLHFGSWDLSLSKEDGEYVLRAEEDAFGGQTRLHWHRKDVNLPEAATCGLRAKDASLPKTLEITPPGPDVPDSMAAFSGIWEGEWDHNLDVKLAVRRISPGGHAEVTFAHGDHYRFRYTAKTFETEGTIEDGILELVPYSSGKVLTFEIMPSGYMKGLSTLGDSQWKGLLFRSPE